MIHSNIFKGVNVIPVLPEFGYVNCIGDKNCLAQYEIGEDGYSVKQTEILKCNFIKLKL